MFAKKQKIKLSDKLKLGVSGPASQSTLFKIGGSFFLLLSLLLARNIYQQLKGTPFELHLSSKPQVQPEVLGAYTVNTAAAEPQITTYTVQKGDTLYSLAQSRNISWQMVADLNHLTPPYSLKPGTQLKLPAAN